MDKIKIIRLQSGEDVLCEYTENDDGFVTLANPFCFIIKRDSSFKSQILITPWLPIDVVEHNVAHMYSADILTIMTPTKMVKEYYHKMVFEYYNGPSDLPDVETPENTEILNDNYEEDEFYDDYMNEVDEVIEEHKELIKSNKTIH
jgi:hypothetical protein